MCVISLRNASSKLIISGLGGTSVHAGLNSELIVTSILLNELAVLGLHDFASNSVCGHILCDKVLSISSIKVTLLVDRIDFPLSLGHFSHDLTLDLALHHVAFAASAGNTISSVLSSTILGVVSSHKLLVLLAIDSVLSVIETSVADRVLEVVVLLRNMSLSDSSI